MGVSAVISELSKIEHPDIKMKQMEMITPFLDTTRLLAELATEERKRHAGYRLKRERVTTAYSLPRVKQKMVMTAVGNRSASMVNILPYMQTGCDLMIRWETPALARKSRSTDSQKSGKTARRGIFS